MQIHNGIVDQAIVEWIVKNAGTERIICLDLETRVMNKEFLNGEMILSVSISRRVNESIETHLLVLGEETRDAEVDLLTRLDSLLKDMKPLVVVGFNHTGYDNVLLALKRRQIGSNPLWNIMDMLERCHMVDMKHAARFAVSDHDGTTPKILSLEKVLNHPLFSGLPLKNEKGLLNRTLEKGEAIYSMWKNESEKFRRYAEGDSHDTLAIFEKVFGIHR